MRRRMLLEQTPSKPQGALYWYGDECVNITGGWSLCLYASSSSNEGSYLIKNTDNMVFGYNRKSSGFTALNDIDTRGYSKFKVIVSCSQGSQDNNFGVGLGTHNSTNPLTFSTYRGGSYQRRYSAINSAQEDLLIDVSFDDGKANDAVGGYAQLYSSFTGELTIKAIWLE